MTSQGIFDFENATVLREMVGKGNGNSGISQKLIRHKSPVEEGNQRSLL